MGDLSRPWDTTVRAADPSLSEMGVAALIAPSTMFKSVGSISERWRFKGRIRATSKPRSALHKEIGPSDLDLLKLSDYQALCLGTRVVFPEIRVELYAAKDWRVLCARREKRPERIMGLECEAALWTFRTICRKNESRERQHTILSDSMSWVCAPTKGRSSIWSVAQRARELCGLCLASSASVRHRWFPSKRNPADAPPRRFEWSSQYHARFRGTSGSRLPRQCLLLDESVVNNCRSRHMPSDTEARAKTVLSTPEAWKKCRNAEDGRASTVCDATRNMLACPWLCPRSHQNFSGMGRHSNSTWNDSGKGFNACAHWTHFKRRASFHLHFHHSPSCSHNFERSRICSSLSGPFPLTGV